MSGLPAPRGAFGLAVERFSRWRLRGSSSSASRETLSAVRRLPKAVQGHDFVQLDLESWTFAVDPAVGTAGFLHDSFLSFLREARSAREDIRRALEQERSLGCTSDALTSSLLTTVEADTKLPGIVAPHAPGHPRVPVGDERVDAEVRVERLKRMEAALCALITVLCDLLDLALGNRRYEFIDLVPPHSSSPCGVIRFAAPVVPRAPGAAGDSPVSSRWSALAA